MSSHTTTRRDVAPGVGLYRRSRVARPEIFCWLLCLDYSGRSDGDVVSLRIHDPGGSGGGLKCDQECANKSPHPQIVSYDELRRQAATGKDISSRSFKRVDAMKRAAYMSILT